MSDRDTSFVRQLFGRAIFRYTAVAVIAFTVGSASIVIAANTSNAPIFRLGDATDPARLAAVDGSGSVHVSQQGTLNATLTNTDFPDAATHSKLDTANTQLGKLTFDGSGNLNTAVSGTVAVSNLPAVTSGVTVIPLAIQTGIVSNGGVFWNAVDVSACRSFSVGVRSIGNSTTKAPTGMIIAVFSEVGLAVDADVHQKDGGLTTTGVTLWGFPTQPGTNEPFYATSVAIAARNSESFAVDMNGAVFCLH